jgi:hypothetical protein
VTPAFLGGVTLLAGVLAFGWGSAQLLVELATRIHAFRVLRRLGAPARDLAAHVGALATIEGVLEADGDVDTHHRLGTTHHVEPHAHATPSARGGRIGNVRLEPPLTVLVGREEKRAAAVVRVLRAGDRVRARGRLAQEAGDAKTYRASAGAYRMSEVTLAAVSAHARPWTAVLAVAALAAGLFLVVLADAILSAGVRPA